MTTDRIFVLMLVIMLPMSGCFGGVGDAEADDSTDGTTVINNYYNNTTTVVTPQIEKISVGGEVLSITPIIGSLYQMYSFNTTAGESVLIEYFNTHNTEYGYIQSDCGYIGNATFGSAAFWNLEQEIYLFGSHTNCTHTVEIHASSYAPLKEAYSLIYSIHQTTPIISNSV